MTKAPERLWAKYSDQHADGMRGLFITAEPEDGYSEFIRTDLSDALIAAAYEAAAENGPNLGARTNEPGLRFIIKQFYMEHFVPAEAQRLADEYIRALTPADARAALERVAQRRWYRMDDPENTPPKDGTPFDAIRAGKRVAYVYFDKSGRITKENWNGKHATWTYFDPREPFTHWTPLLAPPEDEG